MLKNFMSARLELLLPGNNEDNAQLYPERESLPDELWLSRYVYLWGISSSLSLLLMWIVSTFVALFTSP